MKLLNNLIVFLTKFPELLILYLMQQPKMDQLINFFEKVIVLFNPNECFWDSPVSLY